MSRELSRKGYFSRDPRNRDRERDVRDWNRDRDRQDYRVRRKSRSPIGKESEKRRSRSPRKHDKDVLDDNILSEISKLPEPSELWDNQQHFQEGGFPAAPPPPGFAPPTLHAAPEPPAVNYEYQQSYSGIYDDFPSVGTAPAVVPAEVASWNQMSLPPPPTHAPTPYTSSEDQMKKEAAIESEMRHQKAALSKQREDYIKKSSVLKKELDTLKDQRNELRGDSKRSPSPDTKRFLKENTKLQLEIQNKLKTINNVVDMLNGIIGEEAQDISQHDSDDDNNDRSSKRKSRSPSSSRKFNYVYYDPEMHWCRVCDEFPPTAKDYLNHLHSAAHHKMAAAHLEAPWHTISGLNEGFPAFPSAPTKRTPIKGLQFFVPSTAWYCKLCDQFIGDLHCASAHLKSVTHAKNYTNFVELNPHWETDWMSDRQKAFEKARATKKERPVEKEMDKPSYTSHTITFNKDGFHTKKNSPPPEEKKKKKEKKKKNKKKRDSSSSSSSHSSSSESEPVKKKKKKKSKEPDDQMVTQWMSAIQTDRLTEHDRRLLDTLKNRMKLDKAEEKRRSPERDRNNARERERDRERESGRSESEARKREIMRRESRAREPRESRERDRERDRDSRRRSPPREAKKPEIKKMPFIGKMPVYKSLGKKTDEIKKEDEQKKKEEDDATKKRREEMDAEIQKKVAEFKEKIARAQLCQDIGPPAIALPTELGATVPHYAPALPPAPAPAPAPLPAPQPAPPATTPTPQVPSLPKDFQEALDIIFPTEVKQQSNLFNSMAGLPSFPMGLEGYMPQFPPFLQPQMPQMPQQMMMGLNMNSPLFQPRTQLYDTHVPLVPNQKQRKNINKPKSFQHKNPYQNKNYNKNQNQNKIQIQNKTSKMESKQNGDAAGAAKKKEEMDDLAMLGIDASDVGSGM